MDKYLRVSPGTPFAVSIDPPAAIESHDANTEQLVAVRKTVKQRILHLLPDFFLRRISVQHIFPRQRNPLSKPLCLLNMWDKATLVKRETACQHRCHPIT